MHRIWTAKPIEYRDHVGLDRTVNVDVWADIGGQKAVLVLRDLPFMPWLSGDNDAAVRKQAHAALRVLSDEWLPFLLRPHAQVLVLALRPREGDEKAHALVLPLSA